MRLALHYQSLLDSGEVRTRAELARYLGVSRAKVTQVLNRLKNSPDRRFPARGPEDRDCASLLDRILDMARYLVPASGIE